MMSWFGFGKKKPKEPEIVAAPDGTPAPAPATAETIAAEPTPAEKLVETPPIGMDVVVAPEVAVAPAPEPKTIDSQTPPKGLISRLFSGLKRTSASLSGQVAALFTKRKLDNDTLAELEDLLIAADLGTKAASEITAKLKRERFGKEADETEIKGALADGIADILIRHEAPLDLSGAAKPQIVMMVGVNGSGKTTTIGKLAAKLRAEGKSVMIAAGDTFRAAAVEQLKVWAERSGATFLAKGQGADAAGLVFDALTKARAEGTDVLMIDTAGRLQNKAELMAELSKIVRVIKKIDESAPHHVLLVLDATVGQNALSQAQAFRETAGVTGFVMTKLDGTAKGGVLTALAQAHDLPIHFIGVGESVEDLQPFLAKPFARALVGLEELVDA